MSHRRSLEDRRRLKRLYEETRHWIGGGAYFNSQKGRYIRFTWNKHRHPKCLRRCGHRKIRHLRDTDIPQGARYRQAYDYWWNLY